MAATPYSYRQYPGDGSNRDFSVPFPFLLRAHVGVYLGLNVATGVYTTKLVDGTGYTWTNDGSIRTTTAPATGVTLSVMRTTPSSDLAVQWQDGSTLIAEDLLTSDRQNLYVVQETTDLTDLSSALSQTATTTANTALTNSTAAQASAAAATTTANTAISNVSAAISTANTASTNATAAVTTANTANTKSDTAIAAVAASVGYTFVANVAAIPGSPANDTYISVTDSTGLQSFTPLSGIPAGFAGDAGLTARLVYKTATTSWVWIDYYTNNSDARYLRLLGGTLTGPLTNALGTAALPALTFTSDTSTGIYSPGSDQLAFTTQGVEKLRIGSVGQLGIGGATYGASGQVLTSGGTNAAPTWANASGGGGGITSSVAVASTSGASINFTNIPAGVKRITVLFNGVSTTATNNFNLIVRLGTAAGGISSTGYVSNASNQTSGSLSVSMSTSGFLVNRGSLTFNITGAITLALLDEGANLTWVASGTYLQPIVNYMGYVSGSKTFTSAIDRVSVATVDANTFTAGIINILYES